MPLAQAESADAAEPSFDVAVIKPNPPGGLGSAFGGLYHGTFSTTNVSLRRVLAAAYGMSEARVIGPDWLDNVRFDIVAKAPPGVNRPVIDRTGDGRYNVFLSNAPLSPQGGETADFGPPDFFTAV